MWLFMETTKGKCDPVIFKKQTKLLRDERREKGKFYGHLLAIYCTKVKIRFTHN